MSWPRLAHSALTATMAPSRALPSLPAVPASVSSSAMSFAEMITATPCALASSASSVAAAASVASFASTGAKTLIRQSQRFRTEPADLFYCGNISGVAEESGSWRRSEYF